MLGKRKAVRTQAAERARQIELGKQARCATRRERLSLEGVQGWPTDDCNTDCGPLGRRPCDRTGA